GVVSLLEVVAVVDPVLLHELELVEPRIEGDEDDATPCFVSLAARQVVAIRDAPPDQPVPAHGLAAEAERISRVGTPHMRSQRTARPRGVLRVAECVAGHLVWSGGF